MLCTFLSSSKIYNFVNGNHKSRNISEGKEVPSCSHSSETQRVCVFLQPYIFVYMLLCSLLSETHLITAFQNSWEYDTQLIEPQINQSFLYKDVVLNEFSVPMTVAIWNATRLRFPAAIEHWNGERTFADGAFCDAAWRRSPLLFVFCGLSVYVLFSWEQILNSDRLSVLYFSYIFNKFISNHYLYRYCEHVLINSVWKRVIYPRAVLKSLTFRWLTDNEYAAAFSIS